MRRIALSRTRLLSHAPGPLTARQEAQALQTPEHPDHLPLGRLGRTHGLEGALRFHPLGSAEAAAVSRLEHVVVRGLGRVAVLESRPHGSAMVLLLEGIRRVERAAELVNAEVAAPLSELPPPPPGEHYVHALLGLSVRVGQRTLGRVTDLAGVAGPDFLVVDSAAGPVWLPLRAPYVEVRADEVVVTDPPRGLLDGSEAG